MTSKVAQLSLPDKDEVLHLDETSVTLSDEGNDVCDEDLFGVYVHEDSNERDKDIKPDLGVAGSFLPPFEFLAGHGEETNLLELDDTRRRVSDCTEGSQEADKGLESKVRYVPLKKRVEPEDYEDDDEDDDDNDDISTAALSDTPSQKRNYPPNLRSRYRMQLQRLLHTMKMSEYSRYHVVKQRRQLRHIYSHLAVEESPLSDEDWGRCMEFRVVRDEIIANIYMELFDG